jgi:hypothetical protein
VAEHQRIVERNAVKLRKEEKEQAMDKVDHYIKAVAGGLPESQREDISNELSEDIRSEMEDRERQLGRALTEAEQEALLKQRGNPLVLAARYRQDQRSVAFGGQIIGPVLYPFYIKVLSFNLGLTFFVVAVIFSALAISGQKIGFGYVLSTCLQQLFIQMTVVTFIFAMVERHLTKHPDQWNPGGARGGFRLDLKAANDVLKDFAPGAKSGARVISRFESVSIIVASVVALAWMTELQRYPVLILGPAAAFLKLAPIWYQVYFPIVLLTVAEIVRAIINLARPDWVRFRAVVRVMVQAGGLAVVYFLIKAGTWVTATGPLTDGTSNSVRTLGIINQCFLYGLVSTAIFSGVMLVLRIAQLIRQPGGQSGSRNISATAKEGN